ncbi:MAG: ABC transporter ATP-binding protein [Hyphomicrobiaceae bacterium]|nr:ABC transporter ATP-binding protein [Hyphomicrobiaceae bacterium]
MERAQILHIEGLSRRFGGLTAVSDLSFEIYEKEILGLIGPNGAGKSTTFNLITGVYRPHTGKLTFAGTDITGKKPAEIGRMGLVRTFQHGSILSELTVYDNILTGAYMFVRDAGARDRRVRETAELVGVSEMLGDLARNLPHGHQRLLSIGIAFASRPRLLCLDEPLTGLNGSEIGHALAVIQRIRDGFGTTVLLVDHNMHAVMRACERIVVLNFGRKLAEGTPDEVSRNPEVIQAYLGGGIT